MNVAGFELMPLENRPSVLTTKPYALINLRGSCYTLVKIYVISISNAASKI